MKPAPVASIGAEAASILGEDRRPERRPVLARGARARTAAAADARREPQRLQARRRAAASITARLVALRASAAITACVTGRASCFSALLAQARNASDHEGRRIGSAVAGKPPLAVARPAESRHCRRPLRDRGAALRREVDADRRARPSGRGGAPSGSSI